MSTTLIHAMLATSLATSLGFMLILGGAPQAHASDHPLLFDSTDASIIAHQIENSPVSSAHVISVGSGTPVLKDVQIVEQGRQTLLVKTWNAPPGFDPELLVEDDFERGGLHFRRAYLLLVSENYDNRRRLASETVTVAHDTRGGALTLLQPIIEYNRGGYAGQLTLNIDAIVTEAAGHRSYSYTVTDVREFSGLARNDPYFVPQTIQRNGVQLELVDLSWNQSRDGSYTAIASYRGTATGRATSGYISTATYIGEVSKSVLESITFAVVYEGSLIPLPPFDFSPVIIIGSSIVILLVAAAILINRRDNTKVYAMIGKEYQLVHKQRLTSLSPIVDLSPKEISGHSDEFMVVLSRLALRKLRGHCIKIIGKDNVMKEQRVYQIRHFRIGHGLEEEHE